MTFDDLEWLAEALGGVGFAASESQLRKCTGALQAGRNTVPAAYLSAITALPRSECQRLLDQSWSEGRCFENLETQRILLRVNNGVLLGLVVPQSDLPTAMTRSLGGKSQAPHPSSEVLAELSHELKNAFGAILGWVGAARRSTGRDASQRVQRALGSIESSTRAAEATVRHFVAAARGEPPAAETVALGELLANLLGLFEPALQAKGLTAELSEEVRAQVPAPEPVLFSVFWNLIENAVAASPPGERLTLRVRRGGPQRVEVTVEDRGPGIPEDQQARLFDRYYTTKPNGTGLGLSMVRDAVESLQGTLRLDSKPARGTTWSVELDAAAVSASRVGSDPPLQASPDAQDPLAGLRVLIVENDAAMRDLLTTCLELVGADVYSVRSYGDQHAATVPFDLALLDFRLDELDGQEVATKLREQAQAHRIAFLSGSEAPDDVDLQNSLWLRKPITIDALLDQLRAFVSS